MIYSWIEGTGLAYLSRHSLYKGQSSGHKHPGRRKLQWAYLHLASEPHPREKTLLFLHGSEALGLTWLASVKHTSPGHDTVRACSSSYTFSYRNCFYDNLAMDVDNKHTGLLWPITAQVPESMAIVLALCGTAPVTSTSAHGIQVSIIAIGYWSTLAPISQRTLPNGWQTIHLLGLFSLASVVKYSMKQME